jgi:mitogen-activated protein kinase 15
LGELLGGQALFAGESTLNQLEKILEVTGRPSKLDMKSIKSKHTQTMIDGLQVKNQRTLQSLFPTAPPDALDLLNRLLQFNPDRRATIEQAISHPYLAQFHSQQRNPFSPHPLPSPSTTTNGSRSASTACEMHIG